MFDGLLPAGTEADSKDIRRLLIFALLLLLLAIKGDGRFPLPSDTPEPRFQIYLLVLTVAFGAGMVWLLLPRRAPPLAQETGSARLLRSAAAVALAFCGLDLALLVLEAHRFSAFGYRLDAAWAVMVCGLPALAFAALALGAWRVSAGRLLGVAVTGAMALELLAIASFPLHPERSDMLPLLAAAGHRLLAGHNPYTAYPIHPGSGLPLTYLPGLLLVYLPAAALGCDPRLIDAAAVFAAALLAHQAGRANGRPGTRPPGSSSSLAAYLSLLLLGPYTIYRHEIYLGPLLVLLLATWILLRRDRLAAAGLATGCLLLLSQLLAPLAAALVLAVAGRHGRRAALRFTLLALLVALAGILPFCLLDRSAFLAGSLFHWSGARGLETLNLSYWLLRLIPSSALHLLQAVVVALALLFSRPLLRRPSDAFAIGALCLVLMAALSPLVWTYFYLLALFISLPALADRADREPPASML